MIVSTKGRYALRVMIDIAEHYDGSFIPLREIAERQQISEKYLESILQVLVKARMLTGLRGKGGGYKLTKTPAEYTIYSIIVLTEGGLAPISCLEEGADPCERAAECRTVGMWKGLDKLVKDYFSGITLADLMATGSAGDNYVI